MSDTEEPIPYEGIPEFNWAQLNDSTVRAMIHHGSSYEEIIGALAIQKTQFVKRLMELEAIAPRKIALPGGGTMIWRCPDELVR